MLAGYRCLAGLRRFKWHNWHTEQLPHSSVCQLPCQLNSREHLRVITRADARARRPTPRAFGHGAAPKWIDDIKSQRRERAAIVARILSGIAVKSKSGIAPAGLGWYCVRGRLSATTRAR